MTVITTREVGAAPKGSPLTNAEIDNNFLSLKDNKLEASTSSTVGEVPTLAGLEVGKVVLNYADGKLYFKNAAGDTIAYFKAFSTVGSFTTLSVSGTSTFSGEVLLNNSGGTGGTDEGGELHFAVPTTNTTLNGPIAIDIYQDRVRIFETTGTNRGFFLELPLANGGAGTAVRGYARTSISASTATTNLDLGAYDDFVVTLSANTTFTLSNIAKKLGSSGTITIKQDATGGRTFTKASEMKTPLGGASIAQVTTANSLSVLSYYVVDASTVLINYIGNFA